MYKALLIAALAAVGNAMFVYGQRKSSLTNNSFSYLIGAVLVCALIVTVVSISYRADQAMNFVSENMLMVSIGGVGMATTYLGFLGESFNKYQGIAIVLAILAIITFTLGRSSQN